MSDQTERQQQIREAAIEWLHRYNDVAPDKARFDGPRHHLGDVFIERCIGMNLNPLEEQVTAYPSFSTKTNALTLVFIPALQTLRARAQQTGTYLGCVLSTYQRADKALICRAEVLRLVGSNVAKFGAEGNIEQWKAQVGKSPFWSSNPENQTANAMERRALMMAFPDVLREFEAEEYSAANDDSAPARQPEPPRQIATTTDLAESARAALAEGRRQAQQQNKVTPTPVQAPEPAPEPATPAADDIYGLAKSCGLSRSDLEHVAKRIYGKGVEGLDDKAREQLTTRVLPKRPATQEQWEEVEGLRAEYCRTVSNKPEDWNALVGFSYVPKWLLQSQVMQCAKAAMSALSGRAA